MKVTPSLLARVPKGHPPDADRGADEHPLRLGVHVGREGDDECVLDGLDRGHLADLAARGCHAVGAVDGEDLVLEVLLALAHGALVADGVEGLPTRAAELEGEGAGALLSEDG